MRTFLICMASVLALAGPKRAEAGSITPTSYSYTNGTPAGSPGFPYTDPGLTKLTDGDLGTVNPGDGTWVGWQQPSDQITFVFASSVTITDVKMDFFRDDNANIQVPGTVTIGGSLFTPSDFATDNTKGLVDFTGSWTGSSLVVTLGDAGGEGLVWDFVNEAQFTSSGSTAPEPGTIGLALAGLLVAAGCGRKRIGFTRR